MPSIVQSDNEFVNLAMEELCGLLGSSQIFSAALRPQSQGAVERSHRTMREQLAILIDSFVRANPRKWPKYIKHLEARMRHKKLSNGATPYSAVHCLFGSSALSTSLQAIGEIPEDLIWSDWLRAIV